MRTSQMLTFCSGLHSSSRLQDQDLQTSESPAAAAVAVKVEGNQLRSSKLLLTPVLLKQHHSTSPNTVNRLSLNFNRVLL